MKGAILFLGVSNFNVGVVDIAKKMGYAALCINKDKNNISLVKADLAKVADSSDIASTCDFIFLKAVNFDIKLVYSSGEFFVTKEVISSALQLECNSLVAAYAAQNKELARKMFAASGVPIAAGYVAGNLDEARTFAKRLKYPVILKPVNRLGALGVRVAYSEKEIRGVYRQCRYYSRNVIVEKFYEGSLHDVNGFFYKGKFFPAGICDKTASLGQYKYIHSLSCPSTLGDSQKKDLYRLLVRCARAIGVSAGPVKGDAILTSEGFKMMEIALRFHGPLSTLYCLPLSEGILPFEYYLHVFSGRKYHISAQKSFVYAREIETTPGIIARINGREAALKIDGVKAILISKKVGDRMGKVKSNYDIFGYVVIVAKDQQTALRIFDQFSKVFKVKVTKR